MTHDKPIVRNIHDYVFKKKVNCLIGVTGPSGSGKSVGAITIGKCFAGSKFKLGKHLVYTVNELLAVTLESVSIDGETLTMSKLKDIPDIGKWLRENARKLEIEPGMVIVFDEAGTGAYIREFFSMDNITLAKIIQIWRFLSTIVFFVVPVDLRLMESTVIKFLNFEIKFIGFPEYDKVGKCVAYEYTGWNKKKREPYRQRLTGCRNGGYIRIHANRATISAYRRISNVHKVGLLASIDREHKEKGKPKYTKKDAILELAKRGYKSKEISLMLNIDAGYVRHIKGNCPELSKKCVKSA